MQESRVVTMVYAGFFSIIVFCIMAIMYAALDFPSWNGVSYYDRCSTQGVAMRRDYDR
jgi:hypothetical protein